jgi:general stress protein YciG
MAGTKAGAQKARKTNIKRHGKDFYALIGAKGGRKGHTGGFAANHDRAVAAGRKGGLASSRKGVRNGERKEKVYCPVWGE